MNSNSRAVILKRTVARLAAMMSLMLTARPVLAANKPDVSPRVDRIQYKDPDLGYANVSSPFLVLKGTTVTFRAMFVREDARASRFRWSGTSGAVGTGRIKRVTFNTLSKSERDFKTVEVKVGKRKIMVRVLVYELELRFNPVDDFAGRSYTDFGVGEDIELCAILRYDAPLPARRPRSSSPISPRPSSLPRNGSIAGENIGGVRWTLESGDGELQDGGYGDGFALYAGGSEEGTFSVAITIQGGPSKGQTSDN